MSLCAERLFSGPSRARAHSMEATGWLADPVGTSRRTSRYVHGEERTTTTRGDKRRTLSEDRSEVPAGASRRGEREKSRNQAGGPPAGTDPARYHQPGPVFHPLDPLLACPPMCADHYHRACRMYRPNRPIQLRDIPVERLAMMSYVFGAIISAGLRNSFPPPSHPLALVLAPLPLP